MNRGLRLGLWAVGALAVLVILKAIHTPAFFVGPGSADIGGGSAIIIGIIGWAALLYSAHEEDKQK